MIEAADLTLNLGGRCVLDGVSFTIAAGEAVALVGPNGSGKSSLLRCLLGLFPYQGHVRIAGRDVALEPVAARSLLGYLPQRPAFGLATAREVVTFAARLRGVRIQRITDVLHTVGLESRADDRARDFSGGMQQRLSLAVALLGDPPVLLLDEPTASLDRHGQDVFLEIVAGLRQRGRTLLVASHRSEEIARVTDRVLAVEDGNVLHVARNVPLTALAIVPGVAS